jgi:hypothetical protein
MKRAFIFLMAMFLAWFPAYATISASTVWEVRAAGNDTNGGAFVLGQGVAIVAAAADLTVDAVNNLVVTSATHNFVAVDVKRSVLITAGAGWTTGWYEIVSCAANAATLVRTPAAIGTAGGTYSLYPGVDYSQQDANNTVGNNISVADAVTTILAPFTLTSATAAFDSSINGNIIYLTGGLVPVTTGWYQATYRSATEIDLDRSPISATNGVTMNVGGALATWCKLSTNMKTSNKGWIKADAAYTTGVACTFSATGGVPGYLSPYTHVVGYGVNRGDGVRPILTASVFIDKIITLKNGVKLESLSIDCGVSNIAILGNFSSDAAIVGCKIANCLQQGIRGDNASYLHVIDTEISGVGSTSSHNAIDSTGDGLVAVGNYIHNNGGNGISVNSTYKGHMVFWNVVSNNLGGIKTTNGSVVQNNTVVGNLTYGIQGPSGVASWNLYIKNNVIANNGGAGLDAHPTQDGLPAVQTFDGNCYYANNPDRIHANDEGVINPVNGSGATRPTLDRLPSVDPFVNSAGGDFRLNNLANGGAQCRKTGSPGPFPGLAYVGYVDMGALQGTGGIGAWPIVQ